MQPLGAIQKLSRVCRRARAFALTAALALATSLIAPLGAQQSAQERDLKTVLETGEVVSKTVTIPRSYALVVGIGPYGNLPETSWLNYAERDADAIYRILISQEGGNFRAENVHRLIGERATLANLTRELEEWLPSVSKEGDRVLIYFAGHGFVYDARAYLAPYDFHPDDIASTGYPMDRLGEVIGSKIQASDKILLTDSCHSGAITPTAAGENNQAINRSLLDLSSSMFLLSASRDRESSYEGPDWGGGHGVFTYFVVQGLGGQADTSEDGVVTADELAEYVRTEVRRATKAKQTPTSDRGSFDPEMLLAYLPKRARAAGPAKGPEPKTGTLIVESNMDGVEVFLDGEPQGRADKDRPLRLPGLQPGVHTVRGVKMGYEPDGPREETVYPGREKTVSLKILFPRRPNKAAVKEFERGLEFYERGFEKNYLKAAERFQEALRLDPDYSQAALYLGRARSTAFEYESAREAYERAIKIDPDYLDARAAFGGMLLDVGDADEAIRQLAFVSERDKNHFLAYLMLAHALHQKNLFGDSAAAAARAAELDPNAAEPHLVLADNYRLTDQCEAALPEYERYLELSSFQSSASEKFFNWGLRGFVIGGGKKRRSSQKDIWKMLRVRTYSGMGDCDRMLARPDPAIASFKKALELAPDDPILHYGAALAWTNKTEVTGDLSYLEQARTHFERMLALNPHLAEAERARMFLTKFESLE